MRISFRSFHTDYFMTYRRRANPARKPVATTAIPYIWPTFRRAWGLAIPFFGSSVAEADPSPNPV